MDWTEAKVARGHRPADALGEVAARRLGASDWPRPTESTRTVEMLAALADDLNTPLALKALRDLVSDAVRARAAVGRASRSASSSRRCDLMGIIARTASVRRAIQQSLDRAFADAVASSRFDESRRKPPRGARARRARRADFARADAIRDGLQRPGVKVMDRQGRSDRVEARTGLRSRQARRDRDMTRERLSLFDTTLRDGQQSQGVDFSVEDKVADRRRRSTRSGSTTSRAAGPGPTRPTAPSSRRRRRWRARGSPPSA